MDIIFLLPWTMYRRFQMRLGNRQSDILQEVKEALQLAYPLTPINADGPTVILNFSTYKVEVAPAFLEFNSPVSITDPNLVVCLCDTNNGGCYKHAAPIAERAELIAYNATWNGDLFALIRILKTWRRWCNVPIKSFMLERLGIEFLSQWHNAGKGPGWYDWMLRDFFTFMPGRAGDFNFLPVSGEMFWYGDDWLSRACTAAATAQRACDQERDNRNADAGEEWQKLFGTLVPREA